MNSIDIQSNIAAIGSKKPNTTQELIAANIKLLIEQLEAGHSDALTNYLTAMSRFHQYSFGNVLEIARQMPTAARVAGFWTWKNFGRSVKAGQKGIRILAPIVGVRRKKDPEANKDITKQNERVLLGFRNAYVFDRLSRDLCPARVRPVSHATPVYCAMRMSETN
jgi:N-terminal domain of anti-restriction factor ArdC